MPGCQGPFVNGTDGTCPCWGCKCCPPPCCQFVAVFFDCGSPRSDVNPNGCVPPGGGNIVEPRLLLPTFGIMPEFSDKPITSDDYQWVYGIVPGYCSVPCNTVTAVIFCGGDPACCCLELIDGTSIRAVGSGQVTGVVQGEGCDGYNLLINGQPPPVNVTDGQGISVNIVPISQCCECTETGKFCVAAMAMRASEPLRAVANKLQVNRTEIAGRLAARRKRLLNK